MPTREHFEQGGWVERDIQDTEEFKTFSSWMADMEMPPVTEEDLKEKSCFKSDITIEQLIASFRQKPKEVYNGVYKKKPNIPVSVFIGVELEEHPYQLSDIFVMDFVDFRICFVQQSCLLNE